MHNSHNFLPKEELGAYKTRVENTNDLNGLINLSNELYDKGLLLVRSIGYRDPIEHYSELFKAIDLYRQHFVSSFLRALQGDELLKKNQKASLINQLNTFERLPDINKLHDEYNVESLKISKDIERYLKLNYPNCLDHYKITPLAQIKILDRY